MFSKAKIKRFNEDVSCAPPPTKYDPKVPDNSGVFSLDRLGRWNEKKEITPGPTKYVGPVLSSDISSLTPSKKGSCSSTRLNTSLTSSTSASSQSGFLPQPFFPRSKSFRSTKSKDSQHVELKKRIEALQEEKNQMKSSISQLEKQLIDLQIKENEASTKSNCEKTFCDSSTQVDKETDENVVEKEPSDQPEDLRCPKRKEREERANISKEELQLLRDQIDHLTLLRDNLEASVVSKEDTITDLQMQIDLIVVDAEESHDEVKRCRQKNDSIKKELEETLREKSVGETRVKDLISNYEELMKKHEDTCKSTKEIIAQRDIEIELLNDSIATLNTKVSEYERTVSRIQSEVTLKRSQISCLEMTVGDLSIATKEKEFMETMLEDEIEEKNKEVSKLELILREIRDNRQTLSAKLEQEKLNSEELNNKVQMLEMNLKENEVVQQFLEKEVASREAEVNDSNQKGLALETELEMARTVALDLQQEAELHLNEVFCLKASLSAKDYDLESKDEFITRLKEEVKEKESATFEMQEKISRSEKTDSELSEENQRKETTIKSLQKNISDLKSALDKEKNNTSQLEERLVQLMGKIDNRETEYKKSLLEKESEVEELSVKYSDALLDQESTKRILARTSEKLDEECLLLQATERELEAVRTEFEQTNSNYAILESSSKELTHKLIHIEDALACEEAESREIQKKLENVEECLEKTLHENQTLTSANEGYTGQISMLKIDMTKKSLAVEDMRIRIDELREEKSHFMEEINYLSEEKTLLNATLKLLESSIQEKDVMLKDLQNEFEGKLKTITILQVELEEKKLEGEELKRVLGEKCKDEEQIVMAFEEEKSMFFNQISLLENHLKEEQDQRAHYKAKTIEMEDKANTIEEEKRRATLGLQSQLKSEKMKVENLEENLKSLERKYEGYEDQLNNMQMSLVDKTAEAEKWNQSYLEANLTTESYEEKIEELKSNISKLVKESEQLSNSLASKDIFLTSLNDSVSVKSDEIHSLHKNLEEKQNQLCSLEMRLQEMDKTVTSLKEERDRATSRVLSLEESLNLTREELSSKEQEGKIASLIAQHENQIKELNSENASLQREAGMWRNKFKYLENMIEPFREQLDAYEVEKSALLSKSSAAEEEVKKLSDDYAKLLGHNNHKQKIQHVVKLKSENNQLKERVLKLQTELEKQKAAIRRLEEKTDHCSLTRGRSFVSKTNLTDRENKENSPSACDLLPQGTSTPLRSSSLNNRYRRL